MVTICTTSLTFNNSTFCPHSVFICFVWIWEQTAIISLYNINWLVFVTETECVYCAVRTGSLNRVYVNFCLKILNQVHMPPEISRNLKIESLKIFCTFCRFRKDPEGTGTGNINERVKWILWTIGGTNRRVQMIFGSYFPIVVTGREGRGGWIIYTEFSLKQMAEEGRIPEKEIREWRAKDWTFCKWRRMRSKGEFCNETQLTQFTQFCNETQLTQFL